ncbi:hypothetical protein CSPAE12_04089 [Colletotrichum incanum]|nr:hypothetical protein CSPAE12_04089 [Colletotrichum incanum]
MASTVESLWITPHIQYSSSIGALGCKLNTNRVAYWPTTVDCYNICVKVSHGGRSLYLLKIDQSQSAYDISYDAWNYLVTGMSASQDPTTGGGIWMDHEFVEAQRCASFLWDGTLPLSAANSMNYLASCITQPDSWVAQNHQLYNIVDPRCEWGYDEMCSVNLTDSNVPVCPHTTGLTNKLEGNTVVDVYPENKPSIRAIPYGKLV